MINLAIIFFFLLALFFLGHLVLVWRDHYFNLRWSTSAVLETRLQTALRAFQEVVTLQMINVIIGVMALVCGIALLIS